MGVDLISAVLEIGNGIEPDWAKAENFILNISDLELANTQSYILGLGDEYTQEDIDNANSEESDFDLDIPYTRRSFIEAMENCKLGWENRLRLMNKIVLRHSTILLAAGESWGDNISTCDDIFLFAGCGAASAAGFY